MVGAGGGGAGDGWIGGGAGGGERRSDVMEMVWVIVQIGGGINEKYRCGCLVVVRVTR